MDSNRGSTAKCHNQRMFFPLKTGSHEKIRRRGPKGNILCNVIAFYCLKVR